MKNKLFFSVIACALFLSCGQVTAGAAVIYANSTDKASIEDEADLLSDEEEADLLDMAAELSEKTGFEIRLATTDDTGGRSTAGYAENYFEALTKDGPDQASGASYVIDMDNRQYYVATYGRLQYYLTDDRIDSLLDDAYGYISEEDYAGTLQSMLEDTDHYYDRGIADGTRIYNEDTGEYTVYKKPKEITLFKLLAALGSGLVGFFAMFAGVAASYSMKFPSGDGFSVSDNVHLKLRRQEDRLVNHFITTRRLPRNDNHGGGSSGGGISTTHTTSGGYSAGGGGRSF